MLRKIRFSYRRIGRVPRKSASAEAQKRFKEETSGRVAGARRRGNVILSGDEWTSPLQPGNGNSWRRTGGDGEVKTSFSKKSVKAFCVGEGELHVMTADAANSETFKDALGEILKIHPKITIILDNAAYHKSRSAGEYVAEVNSEPGKEAVPIYLPPYTSQLNQTEIEIRMIKERLAGMYLDSDDALRDPIKAIVGRGEVKPVKLMGCMLPRKDRLRDSWSALVSGVLEGCT